jgi:hypothetical protein
MSANACLKLQEVAFNPWARKGLLGGHPIEKGLDFVELTGPLLTAKLTGAWPNVTILKLLKAHLLIK